MVSRPTSPAARLACLAALAVAGCRRDQARLLDDVMKMAYCVKPAVVRVSAYATAQFRYEPRSMVVVEKALRADGYQVTAQNVTGETASVETGAGGSGSGFIIHPDGFILTSGHVVAPTRDAAEIRRDLLRNGAISALLKHFPLDDLRALYRGEALNRYIDLLASTATLDRIVVVNDVELSNGEKLPFQVRRFSPPLNQRGSDLALLKVERKNLPILRLGDSEATRVGESIWSVGYPAVASSTDEIIGGWLSRDSDLEATFNPGTITAIKRNVANTPVFQSNVAIYRGNSGGPAVNREGEVIGISTWGRADAEQIKFLVPINVARGLLAESSVPANVDGEFNRAWRTALDQANEGSWTEAKRNLTRASALLPGSPDIIRFSRDADRALKDLPFWKLHTTAIAIAGAGLLVVVIAMAFMHRRERIPSDLLLNKTAETIVAPDGRGRAESAPSPGIPSILGRFTILNGSRAGERLGLGGSGIRIGRESAFCEIVLENPKVSRLHAEVVSIDGKVLLIDRNSSNGTYVNDQKIDKRILKDGDIIYFGGRNAVAVAFHA
ncbi:MAG TPA: trypsin-like peptidase domain-containing protein [Thermoanaerobaculia bacterium]|nr:trypsin-like peptidase domain-containing protein [Thermoanaerobaculia bacterium]